MTSTQVRPASTSTIGRDADVGLLAGRASRSFLDAAVSAAGGRLVSSRPRQVFQQPRGGAVASYAARVRWAGEDERPVTLAACTGDLPDGALVVEHAAQQVAVWAFPNDPDLPGLARIHRPDAARRLLDDNGLALRPSRQESWAAAGPTLSVRAYRPRRRAVIEIGGPHGRLFVKAVPPRRIEALHRRHRMLTEHGLPSPNSLGWTDDGLLVLEAIDGATVREALRAGDPVPDAATILELLDRLPGELAEGPSRTSWLDRVHHYARVAASIAPAESGRLMLIADGIAAEAGTGPIVAVHGDFYESQLLVDRSGSVSGLLDVDGAGPGDRLDDLGCLLGHLSVLAHLDRRNARRINELGASYLAAFERTVDPADLRYRVAAVVVSLVAGPHRVQDPSWPETTRRLVELADRWLASARRARRRSR